MRSSSFFHLQIAQLAVTAICLSVCMRHFDVSSFRVSSGLLFWFSHSVALLSCIQILSGRAAESLLSVLACISPMGRDGCKVQGVCGEVRCLPNQFRFDRLLFRDCSAGWCSGFAVACRTCGFREFVTLTHTAYASDLLFYKNLD
mmetsp:Transcript_70241/g.147035  ORF Transcript_70241/g.147035 Transcript_70241/m.147035 type:complete len:145 (+) Transcript_70241:433-867(+)